MAAKSVTHAKAGVLLAAYLKILPFFFFVIPGMVSRVLFPGNLEQGLPEVVSRWYIPSKPEIKSQFAHAI